VPPPKRDPAEMRRALELVAQHGTIAAAARAAGIPEGSFRHVVHDARARLRPQAAPPAPTPTAAPTPAPAFDVEALPSELPTAAELLADRRKAFERKHSAKQARSLIRVDVRADGPIGIMHGGDPHLDDDGTDIALVERHVELLRTTDGLFGANVGDYSNNWVGRLSRLYGEQSTSAREAWVLVEWFISRVKWLYLIGGNHDVWSGPGDPLTWLTRQANSLYEHHGARLALHFPNGHVVRVHARHDFKGHSQWNTAHGPAKAAAMGWRDHVLTCGHLHISGYQVVKDPANGLISHALRVASYKVHDRYAEQIGVPNQHIFCAPTTIIDPRFADDDPRLVTTIFDPESAADYLTWLRARDARGSRKR
jgi:hypothetical protein